MDNAYFRDQILSAGFKGISYHPGKQRVEPILSLTATESAELIDAGIKNYGFGSYIDAQNYINRVTSEFKNAPGTSTPKIAINAIGNGDLVILRDEEGAELRMIKLGHNRLLIASDASGTLSPADDIYLMQFTLEVGKPLYAHAFHNGQPVAPAGFAFCINQVCSLEIARGNYFQYQRFFDSGASRSVDATSSPTMAYAERIDTQFNGFTDALLTEENGGKLIEIDLSTMTYRLNPNFNRDKHLSNSAIFDIISDAFDVVAEGYNIYGLKPVSDGKLDLRQRGGVNYLSITQKAQCTLQ